MITSFMAWSNAAQKTPRLTLAMLNDFLQMVANAEDCEVAITMPGNVRIARQPKNEYENRT